MSNQGIFYGSIDHRDNARFTPQDATEDCYEQNFPIGQYVRELSAGVDELDLSQPERDALDRAELRFAQDAFSMYLYDPSGRPGPQGTPQSFNFATPGRGSSDPNEVYLVDAYGQEADWPETPPLPGYSAPDPAAHNEQLPAYVRERSADPQSHTPWQAPDLPPAYTPPQHPPAPAQPENADVARHARTQQEQPGPQPQTQTPRRRSARIQARDAAAQNTPPQNPQSSSTRNRRRSR
ncbi:hypothetical protein ACQEU8_03870 [Streptomyces sp. CA-250714]|uniref:hypothetical protein n=1 Tax=Streptomyces sp. CA-250714 TaxID=3240060 RepID=UPI003D8FF654